MEVTVPLVQREKRVSLSSLIPQIEHYYNPIVLSNDEDDEGYESDCNSYTSLEVTMCRIIRVGMPDSDDEVLHEFDRARGTDQDGHLSCH